ncbi:MAG: recombinase family protein [Bacillaceae bacterium]|nr:recombinase family protein [Bacillaceae bacterium]
MDTIQQGMWVRTLWDPVKEKRQSSLETEEGIIRVAAYCRVSTTLEEQIRSLENQVSHYTHLIRNKSNWKFVGVYVDNGSGTRTDKQRGLQRLLRHCEEGRVDFILTKNISRLSRNAEETLSIIEKLKKIERRTLF